MKVVNMGRHIVFHLTSLFSGTLECIHSDLISPCATPSYFNSRYMLLFVDDFSKYTWAYFVKEKSEVFLKILEHKEIIEALFNLKIKKLRTNNDEEFISHEFFSSC